MRSTIALPAVAALALLASGCAAFSDDGGDSSGKPSVTSAFYPLHVVTERIAGDDADASILTPPGKEPHDLELSIAETAEIADADLVVYEEGFQASVDDAVEQNAEGATLDAAAVVDLVPVEESAEEHEGEEAEDEEHGEEAEDEEHGEEHEDEEHEGDEHDHGDLDPHFWQDPLRMADLGDAVAEKLAEIDPDNAENYEENAADLRADLEELDAAYVSGLTGCERDAIVVSHDAFGYLEKYGLHVDSLVGLSPDAEPTPAVVGELQELIRDEGITTVFSEPLEPDLVAGLASDLDLTTATLDPIEGLTDETSDEDYLSLMQSNLDALREANGCQ